MRWVCCAAVSSPAMDDVGLLRVIHVAGAVLLLGNVTITGFWAVFPLPGSEGGPVSPGSPSDPVDRSGVYHGRRDDAGDLGHPADAGRRLSAGDHAVASAGCGRPDPEHGSVARRVCSRTNGVSSESTRRMTPHSGPCFSGGASSAGSRPPSCFTGSGRWSRKRDPLRPPTGRRCPGRGRAGRPRRLRSRCPP